MKIKLLYVILFTTTLVANAQITITPTQPYVKPGVVSKENDVVYIFQKKLYGGTKAGFNNSTTNLNLGFTTDTISIKVKPGYVAYLSVNCQEFSNEVTFFTNTNYYVVPQKAICGIRIEKAANFLIEFDGILSEIHNNDCKKFYGNVKYKIFELNERNERIYYNLNSRDGGGYEIAVYGIRKGIDLIEPSLYNINDYYVADRDYIDGLIWDPAKYKPYMRTVRGHFVRNTFKINEIAYRNKKVFMEVFTKIGSYHKGCDLCTDFTRDAEMQREEIKVYNLNAAAWDKVRFTDKIIQVGPFRNPPAGNHTTYLNFKLGDIR